MLNIAINIVKRLFAPERIVKIQESYQELLKFGDFLDRNQQL
jgi:hypothetical protein